VLCISGWDDPGLGSLGVAFFLVWNRHCESARVSFGILVLARHCQDLSMTFSCVSVLERVIGSTSRVEWILKLCIGIPRAALVAHFVELCARYRVVLDRRWDGFLAWSISVVY